MIVQGQGGVEGQLLTVPLRRAPIVISVDLPIKNSTRAIAHPSTGTIQQAISELQIDIDGEITNLRSNFTHSSELVASFEEASLYFGVNLSYSTPLAGGGLSG